MNRHERRKESKLGKYNSVKINSKEDFKNFLDSAGPDQFPVATMRYPGTLKDVYDHLVEGQLIEAKKGNFISVHVLPKKDKNEFFYIEVPDKKRRQTSYGFIKTMLEEGEVEAVIFIEALKYMSVDLMVNGMICKDPKDSFMKIYKIEKDEYGKVTLTEPKELVEGSDETFKFEGFGYGLFIGASKILQKNKNLALLFQNENDKNLFMQKEVN